MLCFKLEIGCWRCRNRLKQHCEQPQETASLSPPCYPPHRLFKLKCAIFYYLLKPCMLGYLPSALREFTGVAETSHCGIVSHWQKLNRRLINCEDWVNLEASGVCQQAPRSVATDIKSHFCKWERCFRFCIISCSYLCCRPRQSWLPMRSWGRIPCKQS